MVLVLFFRCCKAEADSSLPAMVSEFVRRELAPRICVDAGYVEVAVVSHMTVIGLVSGESINDASRALVSKPVNASIPAVCIYKNQIEWECTILYESHRNHRVQNVQENVFPRVSATCVRLFFPMRGSCC